MGSSGAGKTTLLDVLAGHVYTGSVTGQILVDGEPMRLKSFQRISSYVQQRDVLQATATVREAITTAALLKLPRSLSRAEKLTRVDDVLKELDLEKCQNTLIGDELIGLKGISGGQRRRVSVGIELVKRPHVLFADEPTSGLDSEMAADMMAALVRLARAGRTVCVTIHQPNSLITSRFDDYMLLEGGRVCYFGAWEGAVGVFAAAGHPCPPLMNPTDHFLNVLRDPEVADDVAAAYAAQSCPPGDAKGGVAIGWRAGTKGDVEEAVEQAAHGSGADSRTGATRVALGVEASGAEGSGTGPAPRWHAQVHVLAVRMMRNWWRNPMMLVAEIVQYVFMALFVGLVYLRLTDSADTGVPDRLASLWFILAVLSFTPSYTACVAWDSERLLLKRETGQGMYSPAAFFGAKTLTVVPVQVAQTVLFCAITYWMVGYAASAGRFFIFTATLCLFQITSETMGLLCAISTPRSMYAVIMLTFLLLFLMSFTGFLVSSVPVYFRWVQKISYLTYAYSALVFNELDGDTFYLADGTAVPGSSLIPSQVQNGLNVLENIMVVLGLAVGTRLLAFVLLYAVAKLKRL